MILTLSATCGVTHNNTCMCQVGTPNAFKDKSLSFRRDHFVKTIIVNMYWPYAVSQIAVLHHIISSSLNF